MARSSTQPSLHFLQSSFRCCFTARHSRIIIHAEAHTAPLTRKTADGFHAFCHVDITWTWSCTIWANVFQRGQLGQIAACKTDRCADRLPMDLAFLWGKVFLINLYPFSFGLDLALAILTYFCIAFGFILSLWSIISQ